MPKEHLRGRSPPSFLVVGDASESDKHGSARRGFSFSASRRRRSSSRRSIESTSVELFSNLPEKAQRQYFSSEEQAAIAEFVARSGATSAASNNRSAVSPEDGECYVLELASSPPRILKTRKASSPSPMAHANPPETFFNESQDAEHEDKRRSRSRRPSFRKTLSLITDSRRSSIDAAAEVLSPSSPRPRKSFSFPKRSSIPAVEQPKTPSQYYQDPDARMKLKIFLASPQNFDQALEHGFPSTKVPETPTKAPRLPTPPKIQPSSANNDMQTFLKDASFFDDDDDDSEDDDDDSSSNDPDDSNEGEVEGGPWFGEGRVGDYPGARTNFDDADDVESTGGDDDDDASLPDFDSPITPTPPERVEQVSEEPLGLGIRSAFGKRTTAELSQKRQAGDESMWTGTREMTLRMTLTKPELRATEEQLYGWQKSEDPLALAKLPRMQDHSALRGHHGRKPSIPQEGSKVRGLWRRMRAGSKG